MIREACYIPLGVLSGKEVVHFRISMASGLEGEAPLHLGKPEGSTQEFPGFWYKVSHSTYLLLG